MLDYDFEDELEDEYEQDFDPQKSFKLTAALHFIDEDVATSIDIENANIRYALLVFALTLIRIHKELTPELTHREIVEKIKTDIDIVVEMAQKILLTEQGNQGWIA